MPYSIIALCVLSLLQCITAEPRPEFALGASVPRTNRVGDAADEAQAIISSVNESSEDFTIHSELPLLPSVLTVVQNVADEFETLATALVTSITTLASDSSGNVDTVFGEAVDAVADAIAFADDTLPGLTDPLVELIGRALVEKFEDSLEHIGKSLQALQVILNDLKTGAENAVAEAGRTTDISPTIISKNLKRTMVTQLVKALNLLRATVPVLKYTIDSTIEGISIADQYMLDLSDKVDSTIGENSSIADELDGIIEAIDDTVTDTMTAVGSDLEDLQTEYDALTNLATTDSAGQLTTLMAMFAANLEDLGDRDPTILTMLNSLKDSLIDVYDVVAPLFFIYDSYLVDALITTLVSNGNYSQYCFYKYKDFLIALLESISIEAAVCVDKEVQRLDYFRETIEKMLGLLFFDFEDISDDLTLCNGISDEDNLGECAASMAAIYTRLEDAFGDMFTLGYDVVSREVRATSNRLKICMRLSQSALLDSEIPQLVTKINDCAEFGPLAEED
ncbi:uncharacterized protein LOC125771311 [Anopheles funestus]|uniref:uncharacterized protein LOC125771311 n=1 Tax=Anopheles funestus TaxID=62324 RepID=UPI0020C712DD|nr:uncharacterized protein LOC125771311 [Anopheles funestus]